MFRAEKKGPSSHRQEEVLYSPGEGFTVRSALPSPLPRAWLLRIVSQSVQRYDARRRVHCTLGLTSAITSGVAATYGESIDADVWRKGVARHATFMMLDGLANVLSGRLHLGCRHGCGVDVGLLLTRLLT
ncbi:hypothetical protein BHM03_00057333 [Ensete ventricosum]|nr:hypothetical protein BHM03_00057333 [Ensete ventricosum]